MAKVESHPSVSIARSLSNESLFTNIGAVSHGGSDVLILCKLRLSLYVDMRGREKVTWLSNNEKDKSKKKIRGVTKSYFRWYKVY